MSEPVVRPAPTRTRKEAALLKLNEAEFFLPDLRLRDHGNSIEFRYVLNAFLTPARCAHAFLRSHNRPAYDMWEASVASPDRETLSVTRQARDLTVHHDGPVIGSNEPLTYVPTPGQYVHTFHVQATGGTLRVLPVVGTCARYLALLRVVSERL